MAYIDDLQDWVREALGELGGRATINHVAREIWLKHEGDLRGAGEHFYSWQYDMRWAAQRLRNKNALSFRKEGAKNIWVLKP